MLTDNQRKILGMMIDDYQGDKVQYRIDLRDNDDLATSEIAIYKIKRLAMLDTDDQACQDWAASIAGLKVLFAQ